MIGIYCILNKNNRKVYIGFSKDITKKLAQHKYSLRRNVHVNYYLQQAYNRQGEHNFYFKVLEITAQPELIEREQDWIYSYKKHKLYNIKITEKTRKKISEYNKGENNPNYGRKHSDETKRKISEKTKIGMSKSNKAFSEETKRRRKETFNYNLPRRNKKKISDAIKKSRRHRRIKKLIRGRRRINESISKS